MTQLRPAADIAVNSEDQPHSSGKPLRRSAKKAVILLPVVVLVYLVPYPFLVLLIAGIIDFSRNRRFDGRSVRRYFLGNGILTWVLSPINLIADLLSRKNKYIYRLDDLPVACQSEIRDVIDVFKKNNVINLVKEKMTEKKRGMIFFKWYGKNINNSISVEEFKQKYHYIRTIGLSAFNKRESTSTHFGPLRFTLRVLFNLDPADSDEAFIEVLNVRHVWRDDPLFIFDDTLMHRSVNDTDTLRYCMFVDIVRPSPAAAVLRGLLSLVQVCMINVRGVFYRNWEPIV